MGRYCATVTWELGDGDFAAGRYSRAHRWTFDGGIVVPASASPQIVPLPHAVADATDPEEAFVAALSSCHMLFFLSVAAAEGLIVERYRDEATGTLGKLDDGRLAMTSAVLRPQARYGQGPAPDPADIERLHHAAHEQCFIANSVTTDVEIEILR